MGSILKPKAPKVEKFEPSEEQKKMQMKQTEEAAGQESELAEREALQKRRKAGRGSLLTGSETGVNQLKTTLG